MRTYTLISVLLTFFCALGVALEPEQVIGIYAWPLSAPSTVIARVTHNSTHATVNSYNNPTIPSGEETVRVGFYHGETGAWSGIATSASNFAPEKDKKLQLHVNSEGRLYQVGFKASDIGSSSATSNKRDGLSVEVIKIRPGPTPHLNKPVVVNPDGTVPAKEPEKTFLQKYWWAIAGFLLIQVVMSQGKGE